MPDIQTLLVFLAAALLVAITPGPGIFYVAARTLAAGRTEGLASSVGLGLGGLVHVFAGSVGISALLMASAQGFTVLKIAGALYLIWLGLKTWREARIVEPTEMDPTGAHRAFREGIIGGWVDELRDEGEKERGCFRIERLDGYGLRKSAIATPSCHSLRSERRLRRPDTNTRHTT
jgi:hypothetical protein